MMQKPSAYFSLGISIKLFFSFWLVVIVSTGLTYVISSPFDDFVIQQLPNKNQLKILENSTQKIIAAAQKKNNKKYIDLIKLQQEFLKKNNQYLIIKKEKANKVLLPKYKTWTKVGEYLSKNNLTNQVNIRFPYMTITGPRIIDINNMETHFYISTKPKGQNFEQFITQLPFWLRVILVLFISFTLCWLLAKTLSRPLIAIKNAATQLGHGKLSTRLQGFDKRRDELGDVATSFNSMAEQLENNISAHQRLLGDVSHELRSPLTRLQMAVALAEKSINSPEEQRKHLIRCEQEVERLDIMIADVLTLSRLENSSMNFHNSQVDIAQLLKKIVTDYQYQADDKNIKIILSNIENCKLLADHNLLSSAIGNVVNNAVKYAPESSEITVEAKIKKQILHLSIIDNGHGVPEYVIDKLFSPFFRVADARDRKTGGTGLGLAIAQQAISQHQGKIYAKNNASGGLIVHIELPLDVNK